MFNVSHLNTINHKDRSSINPQYFVHNYNILIVFFTQSYTQMRETGQSYAYLGSGDERSPALPLVKILAGAMEEDHHGGILQS